MTEDEARALLDLMVQQPAIVPELDEKAFVETFLAVRSGRDARDRTDELFGSRSGRRIPPHHVLPAAQGLHPAPASSRSR